jgi:radical SAM superfamily enzyme YgiQ (UPF0313 family)
VDAVACELKVKDVVSITKNYDLVVMQVDTATIDYDIQLAEAMKASADAQVCLVGPHVSVCPQEVMEKSKSIDFVARKEYDHTIKELVEGISPTKILGLTYRGTERIHHNPDRPFIENLDELPFVSPIYKRDLPVRAYALHWLRHPFMVIYTGRGCPYGCRFFCRWPVTFEGTRYRVRSPVNVYEEVKWVKENMPEIREIMFDDGTFTVYPKRVEEICKLIKPLEMTWSCNARAEVSLELLMKMKEAGCRLLVVGFESANQKILNTIHKGVPLERMEKFIKDCKKVGILVHGTFMIGLPGEDKQTIENTFRWVVKMDLDSIQFSVATPYPGTEFWEYLKERGWLHDVGYINEDGVQQAVYDYPNLSAEEIGEASEILHRKFIFRPRFLWKTLHLAFSDKDEMRRVLRDLHEYILYLWKVGRKFYVKTRNA